MTSNLEKKLDIKKIHRFQPEFAHMSAIIVRLGLLSEPACRLADLGTIKIFPETNQDLIIFLFNIRFFSASNRIITVYFSTFSFLTKKIPIFFRHPIHTLGDELSLFSKIYFNQYSCFVMYPVILLKSHSVKFHFSN